MRPRPRLVPNRVRRDGSRGGGWGVFGLATAAAAVALACDGFVVGQVESRLEEVDLPLPGRSTPLMGEFARTVPDLEHQGPALVEITQLRPGWADGHLRRGMIGLILYSREVTDRSADGNQATQDQAADPCVILKNVRAASRRRFNQLP